MRKINLETWPRRDHYQLLSTWEYPHFNMCANVDLTAFYPIVKLRSISINITIVYLLARVANELPEFRLRIRGGEVIEHEVVHPSTTIMGSDDLFSFCTFDYDEDFSIFAAKAVERIAYVQETPSLVHEQEMDQLLFMTAIPWVSFTSFMHPIDLSPVDSVPRFAWGKFYEEGDRMMMPLSVQAHHALMDGIHMGRYYELVQDYLSRPESFIS
jgi:chloramphenicol O-acetyltransferase type A